MSVQRLYSCDLCRMMHEANAPTFYGIYWGGHPEHIQLKPVNQVERHLCRRCIEHIAKLHKELPMPADKPGEKL